MKEQWDVEALTELPQSQRAAQLQCDALKDEYEAKLSAASLDLSDRRAQVVCAWICVPATER